MSAYSLNNLKTPRSRNGVAVCANLMRDNVAVAKISDDGNGGAMDINYLNAEEKQLFTDFAVAEFDKPSTVDEKTAFAGSPECKVEFWINRQVDRHLTAKRFDRLSKKSTIYKVKDNPDWLSVSVPYSPRVAELLAERHGEGNVIAVWKNFGEQIAF